MKHTCATCKHCIWMPKHTKKDIWFNIKHRRDEDGRIDG